METIFVILIDGKLANEYGFFLSYCRAQKEADKVQRKNKKAVVEWAQVDPAAECKGKCGKCKYND